MKAIEVGGVADHVHILLSLPSTMAISKALQLIKAARPNGSRNLS